MNATQALNAAFGFVVFWSASVFLNFIMTEEIDFLLDGAIIIFTMFFGFAMLLLVRLGRFYAANIRKKFGIPTLLILIVSGVALGWFVSISNINTERDNLETILSSLGFFALLGACSAHSSWSFIGRPA